MVSWRIENVDVMEWAANYDGPKFHCLLADPPYHLHDGKGRGGFMQREWDGAHDISFKPETWSALAQHLLPGAFILAFASSRGWHRLACAMEDSGLVMQPSIFVNGLEVDVPLCLGWACGSSFPKSTRIDTAIDKAAGKSDERRVIGHRQYERSPYKTDGTRSEQGDSRWSSARALTQPTIVEPATPLARAWQGHRYGGQILRNALEPIICAMKPLTIWQKCGKLVEETKMLMEVFLCQFISANIAEKSLKDENAKPNEANENSAPLSVFLTNVLSLHAESENTDMPESQEADSTLLNIVSLWNSILDGLWDLGNSCTISTETQITTVLKTLKSWLPANTPNTITQAAFLQNGSLQDANIARRNSSTINPKQREELSVPGTVTSDTAKKEDNPFANNVERSSIPQGKPEKNQDFTALLSAITKAKRDQAELTRLAKCAESLLESLPGQLRTSNITSVENAHGGNKLSPIIVCQKPWIGKRLDCIVETGGRCDQRGWWANRQRRIATA